MPIHTHYTTLGLTQTAPEAVIKAAYKVLVLIHHPDKTTHLSLNEQARHTSIFRDIQDAYEVLGNAKLRSTYDAELERHHNKPTKQNTACSSTSTPRRNAGFATRAPSPRTPVSCSTQEEKEEVRSRISQQLASIQEERIKRSKEEEIMDVNGLRCTLRIWRTMADEHKDDTVLRGHCQMMVDEYEQKVRNREIEDEDFWSNLPDLTSGSSRFRASGVAGVQRKGSRAAQPTARAQQKQKERKEAEKKRAEEEVQRAQARAADKARQEDLKKQQQDAKAASVRAEKEKQRLKVEEAAQKEAKRIARVRAKVGAAPLSMTTPQTGSISGVDIPSKIGTATNLPTDPKPSATKSSIKKACGKCGKEHISIAEWKLCSITMCKNEGPKNSFLQTV